MKKHGRFALFLATSFLAVALGFFLVEPPLAAALIKRGGGWLMFLTFGAFLWALGQVWRRSPGHWCRDRREWAALSSIPAGWVILVAHEPFGFKIIMDEIMLLGTSMSLHFDKLVRVPLRGHDLQGAFVIVDGFVDKRPDFFPFLLSLVHDVTGYRPENAFALNAALAFVLLVLVYALGRTTAGRWPAVVAVLLFSGLPLLAQNATGGGFDLLNLVMIALTLWLAQRFVVTREPPELSALCLATVLLAQTRYESAFYVVPCAALILWAWWRERRLVFSWAAAFAPLLLLPVPWHMSGFSQNGGAWELGSQPNRTGPVALAYVADNLRHAFAFFFDPTGAQPNSMLFSALGVAAGAGLVVRLGRRRGAREIAADPPVVARAVFLWALIAQFAFLMVYFWGQFDDPVIARLSLPTHLLFLLALWWVIPATRTGRKIWMGIAGLAVVQLWCASIPAMAAHAYTLQNVQSREVAWRREFIAQRPGRNFLVIDPFSIVWLVHQVSSTTPAQALRQPEAIAFHLRSRSFANVFVFQRFEIDPATGRAHVRPEFDLGEIFALEPVEERRLQPYSVSRISRVIAVRLPGQSLP